MGSFPADLPLLGWEDGAGVGRSLDRPGLSGSGSFHPANLKLHFGIECRKWLRAANLPESDYMEYNWTTIGLGVCK